MPATVLHAGHPVTWQAWHFEPTMIGAALVVAGMYVYGLRIAGGVEWWRPAAFLGGATLMLIALASPLDAAAEYLLSMHMLQHVVLTTFGPPLLLLGLPREPLRRLLRPGSPAFAAAVRVTTPFVAAAVFIVNMWVWHIPPLYEAALTDLNVHVLMHVAFMATGLLFWWPIIAPLPELATTGPAARLLYLFVTGFPMGVLALLLLSSSTVIYGFYETQPSRLWGVSVIEDQQIAGVIMGSLGEAASFAAFSLIFARFMFGEEAEPSAVSRPLDPSV